MSAESDDSFWAADDFPSNCPSGEYVVRCITQSLADNQFSVVGLALRTAAGESDANTPDAERIVYEFVRATGIPFRHAVDTATPTAAETEGTLQDGQQEIGNTQVECACLGEQSGTVPAEEPNSESQHAAHPISEHSVSMADATECTSQNGPVPAPSSASLTLSSSLVMPKKSFGGGGSSRLAQLISEAKISFSARMEENGVKAFGAEGNSMNRAARGQQSHTLADITEASKAVPSDVAMFDKDASKRKRPTDDAYSDEEYEVNEEEEEFGVVLPGIDTSPAALAAEGSNAGQGDNSVHATPGGTMSSSSAKHPSQMTREEFLSQFKRAPRRGEIGQSAEEIAAAEKLGYVMSGSRSIGAQMYVDRVQRQLHEREASKLQRQFRKVEDDRMDDAIVQGLVNLIHTVSKPS